MAETLRYKVLLGLHGQNESRNLIFYTLSVTLPPVDPTDRDDVNIQGKDYVRKLFDLIDTRKAVNIRVPGASDDIIDAFNASKEGRLSIDVFINLMILQGSPGGYDRFVRTVVLSTVTVGKVVPLDGGRMVVHIVGAESSNTVE